MKKTFFIALLMLAFAGSIFSQPEKTEDSRRMRPALLVVDVQNAWLPMVQDREKEVALYVINAAIDLFRKEGFPVIAVYHSDPEKGPKEGSHEFNFPDSVKILSGDPVVVKHHASAFKDTDLEKILKERRVNTVFITGLSAVGCALATYMEAGDLGYKNFFIKRSLMSHDSEYTREIEEIFSTVSYTTVKVMLENSLK